jgi:hypothetical protein
MEIVAKYNLQAVQQGWCWLVQLKEPKENGYVQVSWKGANKFAVLQEVVVWANGGQVVQGARMPRTYVIRNGALLYRISFQNLSSTIRPGKDAGSGWIVTTASEKSLSAFTSRHVLSTARATATTVISYPRASVEISTRILPLGYNTYSPQ